MGYTREDLVARYGNQTFVRSQDLVATMKEGATGRPMTFEEVISQWNEEDSQFWDEMAEYDSAITCDDYAGVASLFHEYRVASKMSWEEIAEKAGVSMEDILKTENPNARNSIHVLDAVAEVLGIPRNEY